ncbi:3-oxoacyl-ACP synthase III family protein [Alienimonas sp. DA493]|uniref:3-oxoacyl-ACP synthase III family protein n=1 Tax=Alienimonas sp. DA493 TaxID=3373605 RepID=UPI0037547698
MSHIETLPDAVASDAQAFRSPVAPSPADGRRLPEVPIEDFAHRPRKTPKYFRGSRRTQRLTGVRIVGTGSHVPPRVVTNEELEVQHGFEPGWIERRTGILERRYAPEDQATSDLCVPAARDALHAAGLRAADVDLLVVGTFTPDQSCPSTANLVQHRLGLDAPAFDVQAACSGFMYSLVTAAQYVATGNAKHALVIGADLNSRIVNPTEMTVAPLFGDGAGAVVLSAGGPDQGLVRYQLGSDGGGGPLLEIPHGGTRTPITAEGVADGKHYLSMDGRTVFKWAVEAIEHSIGYVLETEGLHPTEVAGYFLHQANIRILDHATGCLGLDPERVWNNLSRYGNTSAASIPLCLDEAVRKGQVEPGDALLLCGFGAGLTWGTGVLRW